MVENEVRPECKASQEYINYKLEQHEKDINTIYDVVNGVPQEINGLKDDIKVLCESIKDLVNKMENSYLTKEIFTLNNQNLEKDISELKEDKKKLYWYMLGCAGTIILQLVITYVLH